MPELTDRQYWDTVYDLEGGDSVLSSETRPEARRSARRLKEAVKWLLGKTILDATQSYADFRLWDVIYRTYLPGLAGADVLEIGSAPGTHLVQLRKVFGIVPYGID